MGDALDLQGTQDETSGFSDMELTESMSSTTARNNRIEALRK